MSGSREVKITIIGDASRAKSAFQDTGAAATTFEGQVTGLSGKFANFGSVMSGVLAAGAVQKVAGFLKDGASGAMEDAAAMDRLKIAVKNTGTSFDAHSKSIDDAIKKGQDLAFSDGEVMDALTNLTNATGDSDEALRRLSLAQDLARGTGMTLEQASKLLGKTSDENTNTLARYGIQLGENATAQDLMNEVDKRFGGQAAAFAESDQGKWAALQLQLTEVQETIGSALIPAFSALVTVVGTVVTALEPVLSFLGDNIIPTLIILGTVIMGALIPALIAWATTMWTVTIPALVATMVPLLPFIAVAAAIGIAIAALYIAWNTNFLGIRDITQQVMDFVTPYITTAMQTIQAVFETVWPIVSAIVDVAMQAIALYVTTYIAIIRAVVETVLPVIEVVFRTVWDAIKVYVEGILVIINAVVSAGMFLMKDVIGPILGAIQVLFQTVWDAIQGIIDRIAGPAGTLVSTVTNGVQGIYDAVTKKLDELKGYWDTFWNGLKGVVDEVISAVKSAWNSVAGAINTGLGYAQSAINTLVDGYNKVAGPLPGIDPISHVDISGWIPTFGDGGGGVGEKFTTQAPGGISGGPGGGGPGGSHPPAGGGGLPTKPGGYPPSAYPGGVCPPGTMLAPNGTCQEPGSPELGSGTGGGSTTGGGLGYHGGVGRGGGTQQAAIAAQLIAEGVPADEAIAAAKAAYDQKQAALQGKKPTPTYQGGAYAGYGANYVPGTQGAADYAARHGAIGVTASGQYAYAPTEHAGGNVFLDGFRVGKFLGWRHRREAFSLRDPAGSC